MMKITKKPELAPPGAGLPWPELVVGRFLFAITRRRGDLESFVAKFQQERDRIQKRSAATDLADRSSRVLIPRLQGMEDSSRFWSLWMVLDHLRMTNQIFAMVVGELCQGRIPAKKANTADVKPDPLAGIEVEKEFEDSCQEWLRMVHSSPDLQTKAKYAHPWFGPLDALGWCALAAMHMGIHRAQIEAMQSRRPVPKLQ